VIERRIRDGKGVQNIHPAMSIVFLGDFDFGKFTDDEKKVKMRYKTVSERAKIPTFWEGRVWDEGKSRMSVVSSDTLQRKLSFLESPEFLSLRIRKARRLDLVESTTEESDDGEFVDDRKEEEERVVPVDVCNRIRGRAVMLVQTPSKGPRMWRCSSRRFSTDDGEDETDLCEF
jgi:hypothetical protein